MNIFAGRVISCKTFPSRIEGELPTTSMLVRVVAVSGLVDGQQKQTTMKPKVVDIRLNERLFAPLAKQGLDKGAQISFAAEGIVDHQPVRADGEKGDRVLPATDTMPETPIHRLKRFDPTSVQVVLGVQTAKIEAEKNEDAIARAASLLHSAASRLTSVLTGDKEKAPAEAPKA